MILSPKIFLKYFNSIQLNNFQKSFILIIIVLKYYVCLSYKFLCEDAASVTVTLWLLLPYSISLWLHGRGNFLYSLRLLIEVKASSDFPEFRSLHSLLITSIIFFGFLSPQILLYLFFLLLFSRLKSPLKKNRNV